MVVGPIKLNSIGKHPNQDLVYCKEWEIGLKFTRWVGELVGGRIGFSFSQFFAQFLRNTSEL